MKHLLTTHSVIAFLFLITIFNSACKKSSPPPAVLPAITQEGKNTVGFTINGEVWVPYAKCGFGSDPCGEISARYSSPLASPDGIGFQFARERGDKTSSLTIYTGMFGGTITSIGNKIDSIFVTYEPETLSPGGAPDFSDPQPGSYFNITRIDLQNEVISGNFKFILRGYGTGEELTIENGRFDFRFNACICSN